MKPTLMMDIECYRDYFLVKFMSADTQGTVDYELFDGHPLDIASIRALLAYYRIVTFNGNKYDIPMLSYAMAGATNEQLKQASDAIIQQNLQPWQFSDYVGVPIIECDHIDLFEVAPGQGSLKMYGGKMHSRKLQDLPFDPSATIGWAERVVLREYCGNDLQTTLDLWNTFPAQIHLREVMSEEYGVDLRSKSDAQIAEAVMKSLLPFKVERPHVAPGTTFHYRPPEWLRFVGLGHNVEVHHTGIDPQYTNVYNASKHYTEHLSVNPLELLARSPFTVTDTGSVEMTKELEKTIIRIGGSAYKMGIGGLHSMESGVTHDADDDYTLTDHDVASYYPSLILVTGIYPQQIGEQFRHIYRNWYDRRLAAKHGGDKKTANSLKTLLNGTFGKLGSKWSIFYAPSEMIQVTITGQLALLMLIEMLELVGISVVSANTDGIVLKTPRNAEFLRHQVIQWWESVTGFVTEQTDYRLVASRDVNSYVAVKTDGEVKTKGAYAPPEPGPSGWPNPTGQVAADAVVAYLTDGVPVEDTVRQCRDIRQFVHIRQVKGGGTWQGEYLGKAVRWYYSTGETAPILYATNGNKVARTDGCRPMMELVDMIPEDIDYDWYIAEARGMLADLGVRI